MSKLLTIGMPCFDDFDGVWFTIQSLRMYHAEVIERCELLVVDNNPDSAAGVATRKFVEDWSEGRYIPSPEIVGTAAAKNRVFEEASTETVMCMDCHVLIVPGAIKKLIDYYDHHPDTLDLLSGPLIYDDFKSISTHFDDKWSGEMWGTWATDSRGVDPSSPPFEISANGLGVFSCRRKAWLGFHPGFRGFGGEEFYIHEKYRQHGACCLCLPWLQWMHRFGRPTGIPYPLRVNDKVRNYILGHLELGRSLEPVYEHFVLAGNMTHNQWNLLLEKLFEEMLELLNKVESGRFLRC